MVSVVRMHMMLSHHAAEVSGVAKPGYAAARVPFGTHWR